MDIQHKIMLSGEMGILPKGPNKQRPGPYSSIFSRPSPKRLTFFPGNGFYLGVLYMGAFLGRIEGQGENGAENILNAVISSAVFFRLVMPLFCLMPTFQFASHS